MEKYFLLDRDYALKNIARCIMISENSFTQEDIDNAKKEYNVESTVIYKGVDIPHYIEFDYKNNTIKEKNIETSIDIPDVEPENNDIFNEDVAVEPGIYYFYIDKNIADTEFTAVNIATFKKPLLKPNEYFQKEVYEIKGTEYPNYITVEDDGTIREATEYEKYGRGQRELAENEIVIDGKIVAYNPYSQKIVDGAIMKKTREDYIQDGLITLETEKEKARAEREKIFNALDLYDKAVLRGDIEESVEVKVTRDSFREAWLELPNNYVDINTPIEELYPILPSIIAYFA